ncbi:hypothetical protein GDO78_014442 [Eleutherodactylus coqui]|uniref:Uncharacterized protein n=1 Tax=Eleutherodactylus coqui TaxID=57060 RepID=A0A8J6JTM5_ELECQ|nr:hypothetical protein GDO78_014442 [Eleutherodactylus coqui]
MPRGGAHTSLLTELCKNCTEEWSQGSDKDQSSGSRKLSLLAQQTNNTCTTLTLTASYGKEATFKLANFHKSRIAQFFFFKYKYKKMPDFSKSFSNHTTSPLLALQLPPLTHLVYAAGPWQPNLLSKRGS